MGRELCDRETVITTKKVDEINGYGKKKHRKYSRMSKKVGLK